MWFAALFGPLRLVQISPDMAGCGGVWAANRACCPKDLSFPKPRRHPRPCRRGQPPSRACATLKVSRHECCVSSNSAVSAALTDTLASMTKHSCRRLGRPRPTPDTGTKRYPSRPTALSALSLEPKSSQRTILPSTNSTRPPKGMSVSIPLPLARTWISPHASTRSPRSRSS
jgi:hypothetical protein